MHPRGASGAESSLFFNSRTKSKAADKSVRSTSVKSGEQECSPYTSVYFVRVYLFSAAGQLTTSDRGTVVVSCWDVGSRKRWPSGATS